MIALLLVAVALAVLVLLIPAHREYAHHRARRKARQRFTDPGWVDFIPPRRLTPELQRRLRERR